MHKNNIHKSGYDFEKLIQFQPDLEAFVFKNKYGTITIDFAVPEAVKALNSALLKVYYKIDYWEFPDQHLCPPIPGRVDYIHYINDLLQASNLNQNSIIFDVGTGATCIYPMLGNAIYNWYFIGTDIDEFSLKNAQKIIDKNELSKQIELRLQPDKSQIFKNVLKPTDKISACMCNPPFYKSEQDALEATQRKMKGLGNAAPIRNFSGTANELWFEGGEKAFLHSYLYESSLFKNSCFWYTILVSKKDLVKSMQKSLQKLGATQVKVINMQLGNKVSRVVAWTFLNEVEQKEWNSI